MKKAFLLKGLVLSIAMAVSTTDVSAQAKVVYSFNPDNVILPSSQYTPDQQYNVDVWIFNEGLRYEDSYYNKIWGTPDNDASGLPWYAPDYELTDGSIQWQEATSPFSSDEYYKDKLSYRWILSDITGDIYLRRYFVISSPIEGKVYLAAGHDDAPSEWYINGELVYSASDGWNNDDYVLLTDEQKALLKTDGSENVIAVHVHQNWGGAFADCGLYEADASYENPYLHTVADGPWDCCYYFLNDNADFAEAEAGEWFALDEDEADWIVGKGPFSNDDNMFYITEWPSQTRPILVRRHFTLTAADLAEIATGDVKMLCSYDENPKMYLNGTLIWSTDGWNDNNYAEIVLSDEHKQLLREGDNVLAVSLMQGGGGGHIDYGLKLVSSNIPTSIQGPQVVSGTMKRDNRVYNLNGQYLGTSLDNLPGGIYIVGGKKYVVAK